MCPKIYGEYEIFNEYHSSYRKVNDFLDSFKKVLAPYNLFYSRGICFKLQKIR